MTRRSWRIAAITVAVLIIASYTHEIISRVPRMAGYTVIGPFMSPKASTRSVALPCACLRLG